MKIEGYSAIITGGASGMGAEAGKMLAQAGAKVALLDMNKDAVADVAKEIGGLGIPCDVSDGSSVESAIAEATEIQGVPRFCINCAGICPGERIVGREGPMPLENFSKVINVNLIGTFNVMRIAAAAMSQLEPVNGSEERGVIINTASIAAYEGQIGQAAYSASKGGVVSMTLPAARELAKFGVRVNTIAPGLIGTPMMLGLPQEVQDSLAAQVPFPKRLGYPQEFASLVQHIIENTMINGTVIRLDGAIRMQPK